MGDPVATQSRNNSPPSCCPDSPFARLPRAVAALLQQMPVICTLPLWWEKGTWSTSQGERGPLRRPLLLSESSPRTGVTGPYMALTGVATFLCSKEYFVMEHDFYVGIGLALVLSGIVKAVGPSFTASVNQALDEDEAALKNIRQSEIDACKASILAEESAQANATAWEDIITAKKEAVGLQLEGAYRERLSQTHQMVKKRLDYQLETANVMRRFQQKHMADWIINNVKTSITPAQEDAALKKCISDLKGLSAA